MGTPCCRLLASLNNGAVSPNSDKSQIFIDDQHAKGWMDRLSMEATKTDGWSNDQTATHLPQDISGPMEFSTKKGKWSATFNGVTNMPDSVMVCPDIGECISTTKISGK